jgi:hypothetical protein
MASKHNRPISKRGRMIHTSNPSRLSLSLAPTTLSDAMPIGTKRAKELSRGIPLPTMRGVSVPTGDGRYIISREIKKGAVTYKYALI